MNSLDDMRAARPEPDLLSDDDVERLWAAVSGAASRARTPATDALVPVVLVPAEQHGAGRRWWAGLAAAAAAVVLVVAGVAVWPRGDGSLGPAATSIDRPPGSDGWEAFPHPPIERRWDHTAVASESGILVIGGSTSAVSGTAAAPTDWDGGAYFDSATSAWRSISRPPFEVSDASPLAAWNGREFIVLHGVGTIAAAAYDPATDTWRAIAVPASAGPPVEPPGPVWASRDTGAHLFAVEGGDVALVNGGTVHRWHAATDTWTSSSTQAQLSGSDGAPNDPAVVGAAISGDDIAITTFVRDRPCSAGLSVYSLRTDTWTSVDLGLAPGWFPTSLAGLGGGSFLASGQGVCDVGFGTTADRRAVLVSPTGDGYVAALTTPPPAAVEDLGYEPTWTGTQAVMLGDASQVVAFEPATERWLAGPRIPGGSPTHEVRRVPVVVLDGRAVIVSTAWDEPVDAGGRFCCTADATAWSMSLDALAPAAPVPTTTTTTTTMPPGVSLPPDVLRGGVLFVNASSIGGVAGRLATIYEQSGFDVLGGTNSLSSTADRRETVVYAQPGSEILARLLAFQVLAGDVLPMPDEPLWEAAGELAPSVVVMIGGELAGRVNEGTFAVPAIGDPARVAIVHAEGDEAAAQAIADQLWVDGVDVVGRFVAARTFDETMVMPVRETPANALVAALLGVGGFDTWSPDLAAVTLPDGISVVVLVGSVAGG